MSRMSRVVSLLFAAFVSVGLLGSTLQVPAQDKKDKEAKKDKKEDAKDKKDDKKDKKDDKKEEKKEPFKPDPAAQEFKYPEKDKSFWATEVAFGPDGKSVAAVYRNHSVILWDLGAKKEGPTLKGPAIKGLGEFRGLVFANDRVYVGSGLLLKAPDKAKDKEKAKEVKDAKDAKDVKDKDAKDKAGKDKKEVKELPIREGEIKIWDVKSGKSIKSLLGHVLNVEALAISKDGKQLASGSDDSTVKIWDLGTGKDTQTIKGHTDTVISVAFSPDAKLLATTSFDRTVRLWDIAGAKELASFKIEREVEVKDPKGKVTKQKEMGRDFTHAVFTNDGKRVIAANRDGVIKIYDVEGKKELQELKAHEGILALALSPDGSKFATGGYDQTIKIWDANGKELRTIKAHLGNVLSLSFSPDNQWLASGSTDGLVKIWNLK